MTVHMFRAFVGPGNLPVQALEQRFEAWLAAFDRWEEDPVEHELTERTTDAGGSGTTFYRIDARFVPSTGKNSLQSDLEARLQGSVDWYRLGYHGCTHRPGDGVAGPCSWGDSAEWTAVGVSVPSDVPEVNVS